MEGYSRNRKSVLTYGLKVAIARAAMARPQIYPNVFAEMLERVRQASRAALSPGLDVSRVVVEPPRDPSHGDVATNAAMVLAKDAGKKPRELAELIAEKLRADDLITRVDVAGPGFINLSLKPNVWVDTLRSAIVADTDYGRAAATGGPVNAEYVSTNP